MTRPRTLSELAEEAPHERKLELRCLRSFEQTDNGGPYRVIEIPGEKPAFIVIIKGRRLSLEQIAAIGDTPAGERLAGAPIIELPAGTEFEVWEVDP